MSRAKNTRTHKLTAVLAAAVASLAMAASAAPASASLLITDFDGEALQLNGEAMTQAGGHPFRASTVFKLSEALASDGLRVPTESLEDVIVDLPAGLLGDPSGIPTCTEDELSVNANQPLCPLGSQVGVIKLYIDQNDGQGVSTIPLFNMAAPKGKAALFGFDMAGAIYHFSAGLVRDESAAGGYRVRVSALDAPLTLPLFGAVVEVWGIPADPNLDSDRGWRSDEGTSGIPYNIGGTSCQNPNQPVSCNFPSPEPRKPFFTLPTSCEGPVATGIRITGWQGGEDTASFLSHGLGGPSEPLGGDGCNTLDFSPTLEARPTTNVADSPSGLDVALHIPQNEDPDGTATAHLRDTTVALPQGMTLNPAAGNGLAACSPAQIGLDNDVPANCPDASKLGIVEVETPILDHPVPGAVYLAQPYANPFNSLLALYIAVDDPISGTVVKIAGEVKADPVTGQLTTTVKENPQVPFEDFRLKFFGGAGGSLRTPATCGTYTTTSSLTPWSAPDSGPPATPSDSWAIEQGPGGSCANDASQLPSSPSFDAGTESPIAGAKSPLVINLRRQDGTQQFSSLTLSPPQGLVGKLAGIPYCSEAALAAAAAKSGKAEEASSSCPLASYVGSVTAAVGAGPAPYYAAGKAYLTGPYKGAPLSIAIVTPATAGPFDLGTIVVRAALHVDSRTTQITAVSDPIPSILQGIPLDIRSVQVRMDRPDFTLNPTSCSPSIFGGQLLTTLGQTTILQNRFQVGECGRLGFKPKLSLSLKGGTKRNGYPALTAVLLMPEGNANLASISVALPHSEFLAQEHIRTVCTRVQFAADACLPGAVYGTATVTTPLLDYPLTGNVYLRSSNNTLPDLVPDLRGPAHQPIKLEATGRTDSINGGLRNSFEFIPDAPFTKLVLKMQGGSKGLLVNSRDICKHTARATVKYTAHNGATEIGRPVLKAPCPKPKKQGKRSKRREAHG